MHHVDFFFKIKLGICLKIIVHRGDNSFLRISIYCSLQQFPKPKEAMKYAFSVLRQIREKIYGDNKFIPERMAVIFGREGSDRPLNIMTFDETVLQIPGML